MQQVKPIAQNTTQLLTQLQSLNDSLATHKVVSRSGGLRFLAIAGGDIAGAGMGGGIGWSYGKYFGPKVGLTAAGICGLICGIGGSYQTYLDTKPIAQKNPSYMKILSSPELMYKVKYVIERKEQNTNNRPIYDVESRSIGVGNLPPPRLIIPLDFASSIKVGTMHNKVLAELFDANLVDEINSYDEELVNNEEYNIINSDEFKEDYLRILDKTKAMFSNIEDGQLIENIESLDDSSIENKILKVFLDVYLNYPSKLEDVDYLINTYIKTIELSNSLSKEEKQTIYGAFAVAAYSPRFWINRID